MINKNESKQSVCLKELKDILPNIQYCMSSALFSDNKLITPLDSLIFGFFMGFLSSKKEILIKESCFSELLQIYIKCTKATNHFDTLTILIAEELTNYLYRNAKEEVQNPQQNNMMQFHQLPKENINENHEEVQYKKCTICSSIYNLYDTMNYCLECQCIVHHSCFDKLVAKSIRETKLPINCPICQKEVGPAFINESLLYNNPELIEVYEKLTLKQFAYNAKDIKNCPTPGCDYLFSYDSYVKEFDCPKCHKSYCLKCKVRWHFNQTCEQYQHYLNQLNIIRNSDMKQCPFCYAFNKVDLINLSNQLYCTFCKRTYCTKCNQIFNGLFHNCQRPFNPFAYPQPFNIFDNNHIFNNELLYKIPIRNLSEKDRRAVRRSQIKNRKDL